MFYWCCLYALLLYSGLLSDLLDLKTQIKYECLLEDCKVGDVPGAYAACISLPRHTIKKHLGKAAHYTLTDKQEAMAALHRSNACSSYKQKENFIALLFKQSSTEAQ